MPSLFRCELAITPVAIPNMDVRVTGEVHFTEYEIQQMRHGVEWTLGCSLWGEDLGRDHWLDPDDHLIRATYALNSEQDQVSGTRFPARRFSDPLPRSLGRFAFVGTMDKRHLNEDRGKDEVYAWVYLHSNERPPSKITRKTKVVHYAFG
jgi:hypothetical protein